MSVLVNKLQGNLQDIGSLLLSGVVIALSLSSGMLITRGFTGIPFRPYKKVILSTIVMTVLYILIIDTYTSCSLYTKFLLAFIVGLFGENFTESFISARGDIGKGLFNVVIGFFTRLTGVKIEEKPNGKAGEKNEPVNTSEPKNVKPNLEKTDTDSVEQRPGGGFDSKF